MFVQGVVLMEYDAVVDVLQKNNSKDNVMMWLKRLNEGSLALIDSFEKADKRDIDSHYNELLNDARQNRLAALYDLGNTGIEKY